MLNLYPTHGHHELCGKGSCIVIIGAALDDIEHDGDREVILITHCTTSLVLFRQQDRCCRTVGLGDNPQACSTTEAVCAQQPEAMLE